MSDSQDQKNQAFGRFDDGGSTDDAPLEGALARSADEQSEPKPPAEPTPEPAASLEPAEEQVAEPVSDEPATAAAEAPKVRRNPAELLPPAPHPKPHPKGDWVESPLRKWWAKFRGAQKRGGKLYSVRDLGVGALECWRRPTTWYLGLVFLVCAGIYLAGISYYWPSIIDDSYITFRFSDNLIHGHGLRFNPDGMRVEGYTNFLWMIFIAIALVLGIGAMFAAKVLGILCGIGTMFVAWRFAAALRGRDDVFNLLPAFILATNAHFQFWAVQGLETLLQVLLVFWSYYYFFLEMKDGRRWLISPLLAALAAMTRIDSLFFLSPLGLWGLWQVLRMETRWVRFAWWGAIAAIVFGSYFTWKVAYFGDIFPNTVYAKLGRDQINYERGHSHLYNYYFNQAGWDRPSTTPKPISELSKDDPRYESMVRDRLLYLLSGGPVNNWAWFNLWLGALLLCVAIWRARVAMLILVPIAMQAYFIHHVGGDWMPGFRFFQIVLPWLALSVAVAIGLWQELMERNWGRRWPARLAVWPVGAFFAVMALSTAFEQAKINTVYIFGKDPMWLKKSGDWYSWDAIKANYAKSFAGPLGEIADYLLLNTQDDAWILMSDIGQPMWFAEHLNLVDVDGLTDKYLADAPSVRDETFGGEPLISREEIYRSILKDRNIVDPKPDQEKQLHEEANRRYMERMWDRNTRYIMEEVKPEYIIVFMLHNGKGPDVWGRAYPDAVMYATQHPGFQDYEEDWRGIKQPGDVWNHIYRRKDVPKTVSKDTQIARLKGAIRRNPRMPYLVMKLYEETTKDGAKIDDETRKMVVKMAERFYSDENLIRRIVTLARSHNDAKLATDVLEQTLKKSPENTGLLKVKSELHEQQGEFEEAAETLEQALLYLDSKDNSLYYHLAYLYEQRLNDSMRAQEIAREATERNPDDPRAWSDYASIAERAQRWEQAVEGFEKLAKLQRPTSPALKTKLNALRLRLEQEKGTETKKEDSNSETE
ncbi:hypothetical protein KQI84_10480 [bacterium]|nr:hypothetical protein [bacterium]